MVDAREYHERTNHTPERVRSEGFSLDWANKPRPYKEYESLARVTPQDSPGTVDEPAMSTIANSKAEGSRSTTTS